MPVMVCMDGFILTHAVRARRHARRRPRSTPSCRRTSRARCSIRPIRSRSARWSGRRRSWRCATSRTPSRSRRSSASRASPPSSRRASAASSGGLVRGYRVRGRRDDRRRARLGDRHPQGHDRRAARRAASRSACSASSRSARSRSRRCARRCAAPSASSCSRRASASASAASSRPTSASRSSGLQLHGYTVVAGLGGRADHPGVAASACCARRSPTSCEPLHLPRPRLAHRQPPARARGADAPQRPDRREPAARRRLRRSEGGVTMNQRRQVLPDRHLHGRQPPARARAAHRPGLDRAHQLAQLRPPRLPGLRRGARRALCDRRGDARDRQPAHRRQRDRLPRGVLDALPRDRRGSCRGSIRCSATPRRSAPASPRRSRSRR